MTPHAAAARILVVDPQPRLLAPLQVQLENSGFQVTLTHSALESLELLDRWHPILVVVDFQLPGSTSGLRLAETIRRLRPTPTVFYSAHADEATVASADLVGAVATLSKDLPLDEVVSRLRDIIHELEDRDPPADATNAASRDWDRRTKIENLHGIYTAVWSETPERVKATINRFARSTSISLEAIADAQLEYQREVARLHEEYQARLAAIQPKVLRDLLQYHDRLSGADLADSQPRPKAAPTRLMRRRG